MESFATIYNGYNPLTIVAKLSILYICRGPGYASTLIRFKMKLRLKFQYYIYREISELRNIPQLEKVMSHERKLAMS